MLAIVAALKEEVKSYLREGDFRTVARDRFLRFYQSPSEPEVVVVEGGLGRQRAEEAATQVVDRYRPDVIVSAGFAGGVRAGLSPGDLFVCSKLMAVEGPAVLWRRDAASERPLLNLDILEQLTKDTGPREEYEVCGCLSVPGLVSTSSMKAWIGETFQVSIIDMESYWVSEKAGAYGIPHVVVRSVLDPVEQTLPGFVGQMMGDDVDARMWERAVKYVVTKPMETPKLLQLASQVKVAGASLGRFLDTLRPSRR